MRGEQHRRASLPLTAIQSKYLAAIADLGRCGVAPSYVEIGRAVGARSKSTVAAMVGALEAAGHLRRLPGRARAIEIVTNPEPKPIYQRGDNFNRIGGAKASESLFAYLLGRRA
jgi:SOS-response transcriptional repressor LexA